MSKLTLSILVVTLILGIVNLRTSWNRRGFDDLVASEAARTAEVDTLRRRVGQLSRRLDDETARRITLEQRLAMSQPQALPQRAAIPIPEAPEPSPSERDVAAARPPTGFDPAPMIESGFDPRHVEAYSEEVDEYQLAQLELRDLATREGWVDSQRYERERRALRDRLAVSRASYGEDFADWVLFASGQPNRLRVGGVIAGSAGADAGLEAGDVVERYAGEGIRAFQDLRQLTTSGVAGESTEVEVRRRGQTVHLTIPRGPLGVSVEPVRREPPAPR